MTWAWENWGELLSLLGQHVWLSAVPIVLGFVIAVPLGALAARHRRLGGVIVTGAGVLYALPSLPVLVLLPTFLGTGFLSPLNVVIALTVYAVALLSRTATEAFGSVPAETLAAATANGYSRAQRAVRVSFPLAGPVLLSGLRVVSVSTVSLVSIGSLIGVSSLGNLFTDGFRRNFPTEIWLGVIGTVLLAVVFDGLLVLTGRVLLPWTRVSGR